MAFTSGYSKIKTLNTGGIGVGYVLQTPTVFIGLGYLIKDQLPSVEIQDEIYHMQG